jgi:hypothetical protein
MLEKLIKLKENLNQNWTYIQKILFTFSFYLIYKVFVRAIGFDEMKPFALIFILLGFLVFSMDKLLQPLIDFIVLFDKKNKLSKKVKLRAIWIMVLLFIMILGVIAFYILKYYPLVSISFFTGIFAVLLTGIFEDYTLDSIKKVVKIVTVILFFIGLAGCIHSIYYNDILNIFNFIYIVALFIFDYRLDFWKKHFTY